MKLLKWMAATSRSVLAAVFAHDFYKVCPVASFRRNVMDTGAPEAIMARANSEGLVVSGPNEYRDSIWVVNQKEPPWWRSACIVEFRNGKPSNTQVIAAD